MVIVRLPSPMRGRGAFLATVGSAYVASWLLPVDHNSFVGDLPGWAAFAPALHLCHYYEMTKSFGVAWLASAWTNAFFVLSFVSIAVKAQVRSGILLWTLTAAATFNLLYWTCSHRVELRSGFYLWVLSFGCLAVGAHIYGAEGRPVPQRNHF